MVVRLRHSSGKFPLTHAFGWRGGRLRFRLFREIDCGDDCGGDARVGAVILRRVHSFSAFLKPGDIASVDLASRKLFIIEYREEKGDRGADTANLIFAERALHSRNSLVS